MSERTIHFSDSEVAAMQAAADLADTLEAETRGRTTWPAPREFHFDTQYGNPAVLTLDGYYDDTTPATDLQETVQPLSDIWGGTLPSYFSKHDALNVLPAGAITTGDAATNGTENHYVYRIHEPESLLHRLGVIVTAAVETTSELMPTEGTDLHDPTSGAGYMEVTTSEVVGVPYVNNATGIRNIQDAIRTAIASGLEVPPLNPPGELL